MQRSGSKPVRGVSDAVAISVGYMHTCVLTVTGSIRCCGKGDGGQFEHGRGRSASRIAFATPAKTVCNLARTPAGTRPICAETSYISSPCCE